MSRSDLKLCVKCTLYWCNFNAPSSELFPRQFQAVFKSELYIWESPATTFHMLIRRPLEKESNLAFLTHTVAPSSSYRFILLSRRLFPDFFMPNNFIHSHFTTFYLIFPNFSREIEKLYKTDSFCRVFRSFSFCHFSREILNSYEKSNFFQF